MVKRKRKIKKSPKRAKINDIDSLNLIHWIGRFGNRMFQVLYGKTYEKKFGIEFRQVSKWEGDFLFKNCNSKLIPHKEFADELIKYGLTLSGHTIGGWEKIIKNHNRRTGQNLKFIFPYDESNWGEKNACLDCSCWDSPFLFKQYNKSFAKHLFEFSDEVKESDIYKIAEDKQGSYDVAHLRRDDIMYSHTNHNWNYPVISEKSYHKAFGIYDVDQSKVEWVSDDFPSYPSQGWTYPEGQALLTKEPFYDFVPDFLKIYFARKVFRANSSFSWWASFLNPDGKIFSPILHKRIIYSETGEELNCEFIEGNSPHFMHVLGHGFGEKHDMRGYHDCPFIHIKD